VTRTYRYYIRRKFFFMVRDMNVALRHLKWVENVYKDKGDRYIIQRLAIQIAKLYVKITKKVLRKIREMF